MSDIKTYNEKLVRQLFDMTFSGGGEPPVNQAADVTWTMIWCGSSLKLNYRSRPNAGFALVTTELPGALSVTGEDTPVTLMIPHHK